MRYIHGSCRIVDRDSMWLRCYPTVESVDARRQVDGEVESPVLLVSEDICRTLEVEAGNARIEHRYPCRTLEVEAGNARIEHRYPC